MAGPPAGGRDRRARRDLNLTVVIVAVVVMLGGIVLAWLAVALVEARQGLDVRPMLTVRVGPAFWTEVGGFLTGATALWKLLQRSNRTEKLVGRDVLPAVRELLEHLQGQQGQGSRTASCDQDLVDQVDHVVELLEQTRPPTPVPGPRTGAVSFDDLVAPRPHELAVRRHRR